MDIMTPEKRSRLMARIKGRDTRPELVVRRTAHAMGFRFRLHRRDLPGRPDLVFPKLRLALFVHGCFWHMHEGCRHSRVPETNRDFWSEKLSGNASRDRRVQSQLEAAGWRVGIIWECQIAHETALRERLSALLKPTPPTTNSSSDNPSRLHSW